MSEPTITELERELAQREESAQTVLSLVAPALEELKKAREALEVAAAQYVTRTEVQTTLVDGITDVVNRRFDELDKAGEERHDILVTQTEARFALTATKEELTGVQLAGAENTTRIAKIEASEETWRAAIEQRINRLESGQRKQADNIEKMSRNTASMKEAVEAIQHTFSETIERDTKRQAEVDRAIRDVESAVRSAVDLAEDVDRLVGTQMSKFSITLLGNKETKTPGLVDQMTALNEAQRLLSDDLRKEHKALDEKQDTLYRGLNWLTFFGTKRGMLALGAGYVGFLILTAFLLGRPEIVAQMIPGRGQ